MTTAEITTIIGQLSIKGGAWRGDTPNQVAVREPRSVGAPGAGKGDLFILTEIRGAKSDYEALERQLAEIVRDAYYLARGSITASLRRALQAAGDQLYRRNYKVSVDERVVGGVIALVMSHDNAFIAQIGPAALFAVLGDYVQRYPAKSTWLDEGPGANRAEPALGISALVEPSLHHLRVTPGDVLILADGRLASQLPLEMVARAVGPTNLKVTMKNLGKAAQVSDCSALALQVMEEPVSTLGSFLKKATPTLKPPASAPLSAKPEPVLEAVAEPVLPGEPAFKPAARPQAGPGLKPATQKPFTWLGPLHKKSTPAPQDEGEDEPETYPNAGQPPLASTTQPYIREPARPAPFTKKAETELVDKSTREAKVMASAIRESGFDPEFHSSKPTTHSLPARSTTQSPGQLFRWLSASLLMFVVLLSSGLKTMLGLVLPQPDSHTPRQAGAQARRRQPPSTSWTVLRNIAIAIPLLVAVIVAVSYLQKGRVREAEYQDFLTGAQNKFQQAQAADLSAAMGLVVEAEALLVEAEKIKGVQPEITDLRQKIATETDKIGKVQRLYYLPQLRQYPDEGTNLKAVLVQGVEIYVLDSGTDRIFHHRLDDLGEALLPDDESFLLVSKGQAVETLAVAELLGMTWVAAAGNRQTSDLVILNSTGLLEYNSNWGITTAALAGAESLTLPVAVDSFFGNFYILDAQANRLFRYLPAADGYSVAPESYFPADQPVDLTQAVDLAIDGAVYVLFKDGRVSKFESGQPAGFNITGLDKPLSNPVAIFTAPDEAVQHVYIADAGNGRVVQLNKDGSFVRQFKPREGEAVSFARLQDIFVDEISGRLYVLDSNNLYAGNIPNE